MQLTNVLGEFKNSDIWSYFIESDCHSGGIGLYLTKLSNHHILINNDRGAKKDQQRIKEVSRQHQLTWLRFSSHWRHKFSQPTIFLRRCLTITLFRAYYSISYNIHLWIFHSHVIDFK